MRGNYIFFFAYQGRGDEMKVVTIKCEKTTRAILGSDIREGNKWRGIRKSKSGVSYFFFARHTRANSAGN